MQLNTENFKAKTICVVNQLTTRHKSLLTKKKHCTTQEWLEIFNFTQAILMYFGDTWESKKCPKDNQKVWKKNCFNITDSKTTV